jgi:hypothetical protein
MESDGHPAEFTTQFVPDGKVLVDGMVLTNNGEPLIRNSFPAVGIVSCVIVGMLYERHMIAMVHLSG